MTFPPPLPSADEERQVIELRREIEPLLEKHPSRDNPELASSTKLVRYLRGHANVKAAAAAFAAHLAYREARGVDRVRAELLAASSPDGNPPWPYHLPRFAKLADVWGSKMPVEYGGPDEHGNILTFTVFGAYNFSAIIDRDLGDLWLELALYCDVFFDLMEHTFAEAHGGRPVARHDVVDVAGVKFSDLGIKAIRLLTRMGESSEQYPEMIAKTTVFGVGSAVMALWKIAKPFLPRQTAAKMCLVAAGSRDFGPGLHARLGVEEGALPVRFFGTSTRYRAGLDALPRRLCVKECGDGGEIALRVACLGAGEAVAWRVERDGGGGKATVRGAFGETEFLAPQRVDDGAVVSGRYVMPEAGAAAVLRFRRESTSAFSLVGSAPSFVVSFGVV